MVDARRDFCPTIPVFLQLWVKVQIFVDPTVLSSAKTKRSIYVVTRFAKATIHLAANKDETGIRAKTQQKEKEGKNNGTMLISSRSRYDHESKKIGLEIAIEKVGEHPSDVLPKDVSELPCWVLPCLQDHTVHRKSDTLLRCPFTITWKDGNISMSANLVIALARREN